MDPHPVSEPSSNESAHEFPLAGGSGKSVIDLAWAEWEVVQRKIESVSSFPFTVKAWSVAVSGFLLGLGKGFDLPRGVLFVTIFVPFVFKAIESKPNALRETLERRAQVLETLIGRLVPLSKNLPDSVPRYLRLEVSRLPGVALSIHSATDELRRQRFALLKRANEKRHQWAYRNGKTFWHKRVVPLGDELFYLVQFLLIGVVAIQIPRSAVSTAGSAKPSVISFSIIGPVNSLVTATPSGGPGPAMPVFPTSPRSMPGPAPATATTPAATAKHAATTIPGASAPTVTPAVTH